jgi:RNA polymerase sigma factor (sigma-70 family)
MSPRTGEDVALARAARGGNREALAALTARMACIPALVRSMNNRLGRPLREEELDEVVQETLTALWTKLGHYDGSSSLETWAYGFCGTQLIKFLERKRRRSKVVYGHEADQAHTSARNEDLARLEFEWVHAALDRLGPPADDVVRLKHFEELTFDEIGARLSISPNTAKTQYYRALERLRESLTPLWRAEQQDPR